MPVGVQGNIWPPLIGSISAESKKQSAPGGATEEKKGGTKNLSDTG